MKDGRRVTDCISVWVLYILSGDYQISTLHHSWLWTMDPGRIKTKIWQQQSWNMGCGGGHWTPGCVFVPLLPGYDGAGWFVCGAGSTVLSHWCTTPSITWPSDRASPALAQLSSDCYCIEVPRRNSPQFWRFWRWMITDHSATACPVLAVLCWKLFLITRAGARRWHAC